MSLDASEAAERKARRGVRADLPVRPPLPAVRADLPVRPPLSAVELDSLARSGEAAQFGPGRSPRLMPLLPLAPGGPVIVFIHGIGGDPTNQEIMIRAAQARGYQVFVMCYDTYGRGGRFNSRWFAEEIRNLKVRELTVVAHSLGALTMKAAFDYLTDWEGNLNAFEKMRFFALAAPWAGVNAAGLALWLPGSDWLAFARDLAPGSQHWRSMVATPLPEGVEFYNVSPALDQFNTLAWGSGLWRNHDRVLKQSKRTMVLHNGTHNSPMWDEAIVEFIFDPERAPQPRRTKRTLRVLAREIGRELCFSGTLRRVLRAVSRKP